MTTVRADPRTQYEALLDVKYAALLNKMQCRFFARMRGTFTVIFLVAGSATFAGWVAKIPQLTGVCALIVAVLSALDVVLDLGKKSAQCDELARRFNDLGRESTGLGLEEIDRRISFLREYPSHEIEALRPIAFNRNLIENGRPDDVMPTTRWQRFVAAIA